MDIKGEHACAYGKRCVCVWQTLPDKMMSVGRSSTAAAVYGTIVAQHYMGGALETLQNVVSTAYKYWAHSAACMTEQTINGDWRSRAM